LNTPIAFSAQRHAFMSLRRHASQPVFASIGNITFIDYIEIDYWPILLRAFNDYFTPPISLHYYHSHFIFRQCQLINIAFAFLLPFSHFLRWLLMVFQLAFAILQ
jgi:hypothetical protein